LKKGNGGVSMSQGAEKLSYLDTVDNKGNTIPSKKAEYLRQILKNEYGIATEEELEQELKLLQQRWLSLAI